MFLFLEKSVEKVKTGSKEVDEPPACSVGVSFAKLYTGLSTLCFCLTGSVCAVYFYFLYSAGISLACDVLSCF